MQLFFNQGITSCQGRSNVIEMGLHMIAAYVSCLIDAASQCDSAPDPMTEMEIIQSSPNLLEPVLSDIDSQTDLFDF